MSAPSIPFSRRFRRFFLRLVTSRSQDSQALYEEILYLSSRTQSLDELLRLFPERICTALQLRTFNIFLREKTEYALQHPSAATTLRVALPASSSTVSRMRRDRRPALFIREDTPNAEPDGWQLLATPLELEVLSAVDAQVLLPLEGRTGPMGFLTLSRDGHRPFSRAELRFLRDLGPQMGRGLETAQLVRSLTEGAVERARAHRELEVAREVQERLLPGNLPTISGIDAAAAYRSAGQIGGDYYDIFPAENGTVGIVVGDVSGKGIPAALLMAAVRASLHALMLQPGLTITNRMEQLNRLIYEASSINHYATLFFSIYDPVSRRLTCVNAGHNPPILVRADRSVQHLSLGGTVIGLFPAISFESETLILEPGDTLVAYTDGVTEATNAEDQEWESSRLQTAILHAPIGASDSSEQLVRRILQKLDDFVAASPQHDDITLVVLRSTGASRAAQPS